jgi:transcription elongation factor Elf1
MEVEATFICAHCLQLNTIIVDASGGLKQEYIEDCEVCCHPNRLKVTVNELMTKAEIYTEMS